MSLSATLIASPIPRVPPVTIATRAMRSLLSLLRQARLGSGQPARKLALDQAFEHGDAFSRIVEAVEKRERVAARLLERVAPADPELLQGLDTVGAETGRRNGEALDALSRIGGKRRIGCGLKPFRAPEPRLEGNVD